MKLIKLLNLFRKAICSVTASITLHYNSLTFLKLVPQSLHVWCRNMYSLSGKVISKAACKCSGFIHCTSSQHVEVLLSGLFKWPRKWFNMLTIPKISSRLMLNHGWKSLDTLGTARAWAQHVERCCANALDFVEPHMDDRETKEMLSRVERKVWPVSNLTQQDSTPLTPLNRVFKCVQLVESLYSGQIHICTLLNVAKHSL